MLGLRRVARRDLGDPDDHLDDLSIVTPTIFLASFAIGFGIGIAFMPLLTLAMADVPPEDAGLGSGITNLSQQIGGALGLAVLSTLAANHTKALSDDHGFTSALIGGYHLAFIAGAVAIGTGIVLAFALLRTRDPRPELVLATSPAGGESPRVPADLDMEDAA